MRNPAFAICEQPRSLISAFVVRCLYRIIYFVQNLKPLASPYSWAGQFESHLVANPEDRFSRDVAQISGPCMFIKSENKNSGHF